MNRICFVGGLVRKGELQKSKGENGGHYLFIDVARNYSTYDRQKKEFVDQGTIYQSCVLFNKQAEAFDASNIPLGRRLVIEGQVDGRKTKEWTDKEGNVHGPGFEETVVVDNIGLSFSHGQVVLDSDYLSSDNSTSRPAPKRKSQPPKKKEEPIEEEELFADDDDDDLDDDFDSLFDDF